MEISDLKPFKSTAEIKVGDIIGLYECRYSLIKNGFNLNKFSHKYKVEKIQNIFYISVSTGNHRFENQQVDRFFSLNLKLEPRGHPLTKIFK